MLFFVFEPLTVVAFYFCINKLVSVFILLAFSMNTELTEGVSVSGVVKQ